MAMKIDKEKLYDIMNGAIVLGSGGGGDIVTSENLVKDILKVKETFEFADLASIPDDCTVALISAMGSPLATKEAGFDATSCVYAFEQLEKATGKKIDYVAAFEVGGGNFMPPVYVACCKEGVRALDADCVGRAVPESNMIMPEAKGVSLNPFCMADAEGRSFILTCKDSLDCERFGRPIVGASGGSIAVANYIMDGATAKKVLVGGTYEQSRRIGEALREGKARGERPVESIAKATGGTIIIEGVLTELNLKVENMHDWGYEIIEGRGAYAGKSVRLNVENENIIAYDQDGNLCGMIPDALCVFKSDGQPVTNADLAVGMELSFVVVPCNEKWMEGDAMKVFEHVLQYFGHTTGFVSIHALNGKRK